MNEWWEGLSLILKVLYCVAIPSTFLLLIQTVMLLVGFGGDGAGDANISDTSGLDLDTDVDIPDDIPDEPVGHGADMGTLKLFTLQGIIAFLSTFGWMSICLIHNGLPEAFAIVIGIAVGFIVMYAVAKIVQLASKLSENGTVDVKNTLGSIAQVYLIIPPDGEAGGKVVLTVQSRMMELSAITYSSEAIATGTAVRITDVQNDTVVVEKLG